VSEPCAVQLLGEIGSLPEEIAENYNEQCRLRDHRRASSMQPYVLDPLVDPRWNTLVASHPKASAFHQTGWLKALAGTYGYRILAVTSTPPGKQLSDGIVFCEVRSWITGNRLVSLPFSDHAEPLLNAGDEGSDLGSWMQAECRKQNWKYVELRPFSGAMRTNWPMGESQCFWLHTLDLAPSAQTIFRRFHNSCIRRRILHAEKQQLSYERGSSEILLDEFYRLLLVTRRRFGLLPQPRSLFKNIMEQMGSHAEIRVARKDGKAVASILSLTHGSTVVYKFGCSDHAHHHLAAMPYLFWRLIEESKSENRETIDFGRTDTENPGLVRFKDRFGTARRRLRYYRYAERDREKVVLRSALSSKRILFTALPDALSSRAGSLVYRHVG
jgi:hypothetical protein